MVHNKNIDTWDYSENRAVDHACMSLLVAWFDTMKTRGAFYEASCR